MDIPSVTQSQNNPVQERDEKRFGSDFPTIQKMTSNQVFKDKRLFVILIILGLSVVTFLYYKSTTNEVIAPKKEEYTEPQEKDFSVKGEALINTKDGQKVVKAYNCGEKGTNIRFETEDPKNVCLEWLKREVEEMTYPTKNYIYYINGNSAYIFDINTSDLQEIEYTNRPLLKTTVSYNPLIIHANDSGALIGNRWGHTLQYNGIFYLDRGSGDLRDVLPIETCDQDTCGSTGYKSLGFYNDSFYFVEIAWDPKNEDQPVAQAWKTLHDKIISIETSNYELETILVMSNYVDLNDKFPKKITTNGEIYFFGEYVLGPGVESAEGEVYSIETKTLRHEEAIFYLQDATSPPKKDFSEVFGNKIIELNTMTY